MQDILNYGATERERERERERFEVKIEKNKREMKTRKYREKYEFLKVQFT